MSEPSYEKHPIDEIEPVMARQDAIAELSEQLAFAFAWILDARDSKAVALKVYVAAHYFCPNLLNNETLSKTGERLGVSRQAVSKLSSRFRDLVGIRPTHARSDATRKQYHDRTSH